jgi:HlyD family secretion protein
MSNQLHLGGEIILDRPKTRRPIWGYLTMLATLLSVGGAIWAWESGYRPPFLSTHRPEMDLGLFEVDRGDVTEYIVENGSLESATNTVVRCEVEALMGMIGGMTGAGGISGTSRSGSTSSSGSGQGGSGTTGGQSGGGTSGGSAGGGGSQGAATAKANSKAEASKKRSGSGGSGSSSASSGGGSSGSSGGSISGPSSSSGSSGTASSDTSTTGTGSGKPVIRSFTYAVTPHTPLRGASTKSTTTTAAKSTQSDQATGGGGSGGGGRGGQGMGGGRGGRGGGNMFEEEKPGSTRIVSILAEGTHIQKGQLVCELDASSFQDELKAQLIRYVQAKSWVDQARAILEVNEITLREYRDGIYPQDLQLIRQYIQTCRMEKERAERNLTWSRDMAKKGFRTTAQLKADQLNDQQARIALQEAEGMLERLEKFTGSKIIKSLEAKVKAIEADKKNQEASFQLEQQRRDRLQKNINNCTLRAPEDGILVYVNQTNGWGRVIQQIDQGVTVREGQPIFQLPDPKHMRVKARINETKVGHIKTGQEALIKVDAFPERPMHGTVAEVTAISTPVNGPFSDVRIYYASVNIDEGFEDLRPGLTAEVFFRTDTRFGVTRVPIQAIRVIDGKHYVAVHEPSRQAEQNPSWRWKRVELGLSDPDFVEVISGVKQGDQVVANSRSLPAPESMPEKQAEGSTVASLSMQP